MIDTPAKKKKKKEKEKESKYNTKNSHQIIREESKRRKRKIKSYKNISIILTNGNKNLDINNYIKYIWT